MITIQSEIITLTDAIRRHLYFSLLDGKKHFIDFEEESHYWAFDNVENQICIALFDRNEENNEAEKEIYDNINNRRTQEINLIVFKDSMNNDFLKDFHITSSYKYSLLSPRETDYKSDQNSKFQNIEIIQKYSEFISIPNLNIYFPISTWKKDILILFKKSYFSVWRVYDQDQKTTTHVIICMKFHDLMITEIICTTDNKSEHLQPLLQRIQHTFNTDNLPLLFITKNNNSPLSDDTSNASRIINYYNIKKRTKKDIILNKVPHSAVLKKKTDYYESLYQLIINGLPKHNDLPKNWDSFAAMSIITNSAHIDHEDAILDAGGEYYSAIMHQLAAFGFKELYCINTVFKEPSRIGLINYIPGDITATIFKDRTFKAITCLSVIEHGVNLNQFFAESSRILTDDGLLFLSTDYWHKPVNTHNKEAYGVPVKIFSRQDIEEMILTAEYYGLYLLIPIDLKCLYKVVEWEELSYTFIYLTFYKKQ